MNCRFILITVPVRANKDIWILGDVFLTEAIAVLREIQNLKRDELYLYSHYDPQVYYPKLLSKDTFASQIKCQLFTALEEHNKLPAIIIMVIGNQNIEHKVFNPDCTRKVWSALFREIQRSIKIRKEDLPSKAKSADEPRVFVTNLVPKFKDHNERADRFGESFKTKRRRFNGMIPQIASEYGFSVIQINGIIPDSTEYFVTSTGQLSGKGVKEFWTNLSKELKLHDVRFEEEKKNEIIQEYFDQQREQRRLNQERSRVAQERYTMSRSVSVGRLDRGEGQHLNRAQARAKSVPVSKQNKRKHVK